MTILGCTIPSVPYQLSFYGYKLTRGGVLVGNLVANKCGLYVNGEQRRIANGKDCVFVTEGRVPARKGDVIMNDY